MNEINLQFHVRRFRRLGEARQETRRDDFREQIFNSVIICVLHTVHVQYTHRIVMGGKRSYNTFYLQKKPFSDLYS